jgi:hypothetical protein
MDHELVVVTSPRHSRKVHVLVNTANVLGEMLAYSRKFSSIYADHPKSVHLGGGEVQNTCMYRGFRRNTPFPVSLGRIGSIQLPENLLNYAVEAACWLHETYSDLKSSSSQIAYIINTKALTFLSDFEAPDPVHPVVYSPYQEC